MFALCITVLSLLDFAWAYSSGLNTECDAHAAAGCSIWYQGNRKNCTDPAKGFMPWVAKPVRSAMYSLRSGNGAVGTDPTSYTPGDEMSIFITVNKAGQQYRGLLLHAVNASGGNVGSWRFPVNGNNDFWAPKTCPGAVLHKTAGVKPYIVEFRFQAPMGVGAITFRALIKQGPANTGYFYYPNLAGDLVLTAGGSSVVSPVYTGAASCEAVCGPGNVNDIALRTAASYSGFSRVITPKLGCVYPLLSSCVPITPFIDTSTNMCYFQDSNCASWRNLTQSSTAKLICPCGQPIASASTKVSPLLLLIPLLGLFNRKNILVITLLLLVQHSFAHNWVHSPSRAAFQASTIPPCQMRKDADTHAQVGPGQAFQFKWAAGHDGWPARIVILRGEDVELLDDESIEEIIDAYIAEAIAAGSLNRAFAPETMRYHGVGEDVEDAGVAWEKSTLNGGVVAPTDMFFLNHTRVPTEKLWKYKTGSIPNDVRVDYASAKYPWILAAARFPHEIDTPSEWDGIHVKMPPHAKPGHHVLYWRWQGYTDCTDVDYFATTVTNIYGIQTDGAVWSKIDHCQYVINEFPWCQDCDSGSCYSPVLECPATPVRAMDDFAWTPERYRVGVQVTPAVMPPTVAPAVRGPLYTGIPWWEESCVGAAWTNLTNVVMDIGTNYIRLKQPEPIGQVQFSGLDGWPENYLNHTYFVSNTTTGGVSCGSPQMPGAYRGGSSAVVWCAGVVGSYVLRTTSAGEGTNTIAMSKATVVRAYPAGVTENTMVCYPVNVRQTTPVASEYVVSLDPSDPVFYSTCYTRELNISWLSPPPPPPQPPRWHFNGQCVDCGSFEANKWADEHPLALNPDDVVRPLQFTLVPRWKMAPPDKCVDCDREKQPATKPYYESYYILFNATANEGFQCSSTGSTCGAGVECLKEVVVNGKWANGKNPDWMAITELDCLGHAASDPDCGSEVMLGFKDFYSFGGCACWRKDACCGSCRTEKEDYEFYARMYTNKISSADPTCARGVKSASGKMCCPAECQVLGVNYCGHTDCLKYGGTCCNYQGLASNCSEHGAPCKI